MEQQVTILFALVNGHLDDVEISKVIAFEAAFHDFITSNHPEILESIASDKDVSDETGESLNKAILEFKESVPY